MSRRRKHNSQAVRILGRIGQEVGRAGEVRILKACNDRSRMPSWWQGIRHGTRKEDMDEATDCIISTDVGEIRINVKTSLREKELPERNKKGVAIVFVNLDESDAEIRKRVIEVVASERQGVFNKSKQKTDR